MARRETAILILLIEIVFAARLLPGPRTIDDAYITFRYARNILAGNGFVYNTGERVLGTTDAWILYRLSKQLGNGPLVGLALAAVRTIQPVRVTFTIGGMDMSVCVASVPGNLATYLDGRWRASKGCIYDSQSRSCPALEKTVPNQVDGDA